MNGISVVITTYNRPDALAAVLEGYAAQTDGGFEIVIADDGSTAETQRVVDRYQARLPLPVAHVWHPDTGFRAAAIRNRAIERTQSEYVVFTDGDCVPRPSFVAAHKRLAEVGCFVSGNRILLGEDYTRTVLAQRISIHSLPFSYWLRRRWWKDINRLLPLCRLPIPRLLRRYRAGHWEGAKTCNLGVWRSDLLAVGGFDEAYSGWGLEDSDLVVRLLNRGLMHKSARFAAPVLHLWHRENPRCQLPRNRERLEMVLASQRTVAEQGIGTEGTGHSESGQPHVGRPHRSSAFRTARS